MNPTINYNYNHGGLLLAKQEFDSIKKIPWPQHIVNHQGFTVGNFHRSQVFNTEKPCFFCHGSRYMYKQDAFGNLIKKKCRSCNGTGKRFYDSTGKPIEGDHR